MVYGNPVGIDEIDEIDEKPAGCNRDSHQNQRS
jgi:hypothetical protein